MADEIVATNVEVSMIVGDVVDPEFIDWKSLDGGAIYDILINPPPGKKLGIQANKVIRDLKTKGFNVGNDADESKLEKLVWKRRSQRAKFADLQQSGLDFLRDEMHIFFTEQKKL